MRPITFLVHFLTKMPRFRRASKQMNSDPAIPTNEKVPTESAKGGFRT